jgi:hypothetical protein
VAFSVIRPVEGKRQINVIRLLLLTKLFEMRTSRNEELCVHFNRFR